MTTTRHSTRGTRPAQVARPAAIEQHPIWLSALLHLAPGAALTAFVVAAYAVLEVDPLIGLLVGILVVLAPLELGYLALYAHRNRGTWSPLAATDYRERLPLRRLLLTGLGLAAWMIVLVAFSFAVLDEWLSDAVFFWLPEAIGSMATIEGGDDPLSTGVLVAFVVLFFVANGVVGPVTEELYFRGHLLPRIERLGRGAPVLDTALFTLYHFHSPWRWPVIFFGFLPICTATWRRRSLRVGLAAHLIVNNVFVVMLLAGLLAA
jgi:membrane protease YdiL (CAAX protease family)